MGDLGAFVRFSSLDNDLATSHDEDQNNFDPGDGNPPLTAFTADDPYPCEETRRERDREQVRIRNAISRSQFLPSTPPANSFAVLVVHLFDPRTAMLK